MLNSKIQNFHDPTNYSKLYFTQLQRLIYDGLKFIFVLVVVFLSVSFVAANLPGDIMKLFVVMTTIQLNQYDTNKQKDILSYRNETLDVIFLGSSRAKFTFDPRYFKARGLKVFNLATDGQTPMNSRQLLASLINEFHFSSVVIEVHPELFIRSGAEGYINLYGSYRSVLKDNYSFILQSMDRRVILSYICWQLRINSIADFTGTKQKYITGGYNDFEHPVFFRNGALDFKQMDNELQYKSLRSILQLSKANNIPISAVIVPALHDTPLSEIRYNEIVPKIDRICSEAGIPFFDFNNVVDYDTSYFMDIQHLGPKGVQDFLPIFYSKMHEIGVYPFKLDSSGAPN